MKPKVIIKEKHCALFIGLVMMIACKNETNTIKDLKDQKSLNAQISKIEIESFDVKKDSLTFKSATIENYDTQGNSIDLYWIGTSKDTVLKFYPKYDEQKNLIGAEYYEEGETEPSKDTVYYNSDGLKVEASLNDKNQITWKSTITINKSGNPVYQQYENGNGEYRGFDSLAYDSNNRVIRGFYENSKGRRSGIKSYQYIKSDEIGNWTERMMYVNDTLKQKQIRKITYHEM